MFEALDFVGPSVLVDRLLHAEQEVLFLVGAPLCTPVGETPGVPGVPGVIERIRAEFLPVDGESAPRAERKAQALDALDARLLDADNPYQSAFRFLIARRGLQAANRLITRAVLDAGRAPVDEGLSDPVLDTLEYDPGAWYLPPAVRALGSLVARHRQRFGRAVLTTNFDPLIEVAIRAAGGNAHSAVLVADGSLESTRGEGTLVVHAHGYWHGADTLHTPAALEQERLALRRSLARLYERRLLVVMAYGGWDDVFTRTLAEVVGDQGAFTEVVWCFFEDDPEQIVERCGHILEQLRPALLRQRATLVRGVDCHAVLPELVEALDRETAHAEEEVVGRDSVFAALFDALEARHPVQLVGEPQMGKSALLQWLARRPAPDDWTAVAIEAGRLARRSPVGLAWAAIEAADRRDALGELIRDRAAVPDVHDALRVLDALAPLRLMIDDADALGGEGHGFNAAFFARLSKWSAEGRFQWISTASEPLSQSFADLDVPFFDEARIISIGELDRSAVERMLEESLGEQAGRHALRLGGTLPAAVRWLARQRGPLTSDPNGTAQRFRSWIRPLLRRWWQAMSEPEQRLARDAARGVLPMNRLRTEDGPVATRLAARGLLVHVDGGWTLNGQAWRDYVRSLG